MKRAFYFVLLVLSASFLIYSCDNGDDTPAVKKVMIGAQDNATTGGFYSVSENNVYTQDQAYQKQAAIDLFCFYEVAHDNFITIASPGSHITGIFSGNSSVENWDTLNTTYFNKTTLTVGQFDALVETDKLIETSFDTANNFKKAKDLKIDDIWAFQAEAATYGLFKVTDVVRDSIGSVTFEVKVKK